MAAFTRIAFLCIASIALSACGEGGGSSGSSSGGGSSSASSASSSTSGSSGAAAMPPASAPTPALAYVAAKTFRFSWTDVSDASHYKLLEDPDGASGYTQVGNDIAPGTQTVDHVVPLYKRVNARYLLQACSDGGCTDSTPVGVSGNLAEAIGYFKASNAESGDLFGYSLSLSVDGNTLAVGAYAEGSSATGINGDQDDNGSGVSGAVYIFSHNNNSWNQQAYIKGNNTGSIDAFGYSVSLSADGDRLAVGAPGEQSAATGINGDQNDNSAPEAGAAYLFSRDSAGNWSQLLYIKASNTDAGDRFGESISLSGNGTTLAVGAIGESSAAHIMQEINGDEEDDNSVPDAGAVYVFNQPLQAISSWQQQAYIKTRYSRESDNFGQALALSADGNRLAVGMPNQDSPWSEDESIGGVLNSGAVYVYSRDNNVWSREAYLKVEEGEANIKFGGSISLSGDGNTLAAGAHSYEFTGAAFIFTRGDTAGWDESARIRLNGNFQLGRSIALSADGGTLAVGAPIDISDATGINGDQNDGAHFSGAVYLYTFNNIDWIQQAYIKASNTDIDDLFGINHGTLSLSGNGDTLAVGVSQEDSAATGLNGDQTDNSATEAGAVYLY